MRLIDADAAIEVLNTQAEEMSHWVERYQEQRRGVLTAVNIVSDCPSIQPEQQWIPVEEKLPEEDGSYLVCGRWGSGKIAVGDCEYSTEDGYFQTVWNFDVLAWMPLPEPWKGEQE